MRVQNADGSVEVQRDEEPWDGSSSATSSSDVSTPLAPASSPSLEAADWRRSAFCACNFSNLACGARQRMQRLVCMATGNCGQAWVACCAIKGSIAHRRKALDRV